MAAMALELLLKHSFRIKVTIPIPLLLNFIMMWLQTNLFPNFPIQGVQNRFANINPTLGKLPSSRNPGALTD